MFIPLHALAVAVVRKFRQVVLRHNAEFAYLRKQLNFGVSEFVCLVTIPENGANPLRQNLPNALLTAKRRTLSVGTIQCLPVVGIGTLFLSVEFAESYPRAPKRL